MPTTSAGARRSAHGVKSTTSAKRIDAELNWSAIGCVCAFSCSAIERGRMLRSRFSDFACSIAQRVDGIAALGGEQGQQREHDGAADHDVEGEHRGREPAGRGRRPSAEQLPGDPRPEEDDDVGDVPASGRSDVAEHEGAERSEDAPQARRPPESRKPPSGIIDSVGASRMSSRLTRSSWARSRVREKTADRAEQHEEVDDRHEADRRSEAEVEDAPEQRRSAGSASRSARAAPCWRGCRRRRPDRRRSAPGGRARDRRPAWCARTGSTPATLRHHPMHIQARRSGRRGVHVPFGALALGRRRRHPGRGAVRPGGADGSGDVRGARRVRRRSARRRPAARRRGVRRPAHRGRPTHRAAGRPRGGPPRRWS